MEHLRKNCCPFRFIKASQQSLVALSIIVLGLCGCSHPISDELRQSIDSSITFPRMVQSTQVYKNKPVMFGGMIAEIRNLPDHTEIEVIQKELDDFGCPDHGDESGGRFIFVKDGFLDPEIFAKGRYITGAGKIEGDKTGKVDKQDYRFPVIEARELHLWEEHARDPYYSSYPYGRPFGRPGYSRFRYPGYLGFGSFY